MGLNVNNISLWGNIKTGIEEEFMESLLSRRELIRKAGGLGLALAGIELMTTLDLFNMVESVEAAVKPTLVVASKGSAQAMVFRAVAKLGGIQKFVKSGAKVLIKPNAAWSRTPEQAANTNPEVVDAIIKLCKKAGASQILIQENSCDNYQIAFKESGIQAVCNRNGVKMLAADKDSFFNRVNIPRGKTLKSAAVMKAILEADCYINCPIVKVHSAGVVTVAMKNQMGTVQDRGEFHRAGLHQCIADLATVMKPHLNIVDATRMLLTRGPKGPGKVKNEGKILAGTDIVAIDAYASKLMGIDPNSVGHIIEAFKLGLGQMDLAKVNIVEA